MPTHETSRGDGQGPGDQSGGMPRWVKVFAATMVALVLVAVMPLSGGKHGPGRHLLDR